MATQNRYAQRQRNAPAVTRTAPGRRPGASTARPAPEQQPTVNKRPYIIAGSAFAALALGTALFDYVTKPESDAPTAGCVIAVDPQFSASTMRDAYRQWLPAQAEACAADARADLSIALVSGETRTSTVTPITGALSDLDYTGDATNDDTIAGNEIDRVVKEADKAILDAPKQQPGTDIIGMLCVAHDLLKRHSPSTLILDTDGINNHGDYRLARIPLDDANITRYVDELKTDGQLCDLTGTQVHMYGVGIGSGTSNMSDAQLSGVRKFWEAVIRATGADLVTYQRNP